MRWGITGVLGHGTFGVVYSVVDMRSDGPDCHSGADGSGSGSGTGTGSGQVGTDFVMKV